MALKIIHSFSMIILGNILWKDSKVKNNISLITNLSKCFAVLRVLDWNLLFEIVESSINLQWKVIKKKKAQKINKRWLVPGHHLRSEDVPAVEDQPTPYKNPWTKIKGHLLLEIKGLVLILKHPMEFANCHLEEHHSYQCYHVLLMNQLLLLGKMGGAHLPNFQTMHQMKNPPKKGK